MVRNESSYLQIIVYIFNFFSVSHKRELILTCTPTYSAVRKCELALKVNDHCHSANNFIFVILIYVPPHYQLLVTKCDLDQVNGWDQEVNDNAVSLHIDNTTSRLFQEISFDIYTPKIRPEEENVNMTFNIIGQALSEN